jgi:hypothetical protein
MGNSNMYQSADDAKNLIIDNWSLSSQPDITFLWEEKSTGFMDDRRDFILITPTNEDPQYFGLYGQDFLHTIYVKIEIHSFQNLQHHEDLTDEVFRIVKANIRGTTYVDLMLMQSNHENDLYRNIYRHTIVMKYRKLNP